MANQQLLEYIKQELQQGVNKEQLKGSLVANGWQDSDIEEAFNSMSSSSQPSQPVAQDNIPFQSPPAQSSKNKLFVVAICIVGLLFISGGAVFGYVYYFPSPEKIVQKMTLALTEITSLEYSGEIRAEVTTGNALGGGFAQPTETTANKKMSTFSTSFNGVSDVHDLNNPEGSFSLNVTTDALGQGDFAFGFEIRTIDHIIYVKISNVPNVDFFDLRDVANQWIKIDTEALKKQFGLEESEEQDTEAQKKYKLSPEQIEKIKIAVQQAGILKVTEKLASEKIEGMNMYHYKFTIDREGIKKLFIDMSHIIQDKTVTEKELADFDKSFEAVELPEGEIWIGKNDFLPYKIFLSSIIKETDKSNTSGKMSFTLLFKNFNKPVQIEIPSPVRTLEEIIDGLSGGQMQGLEPNTNVPTQ